MNDYLKQCKEVQNNRNIRSVMRHAFGEFIELTEEIDLLEVGGSAGPDGIVGEATDVILCMLDVISLHDPEITMEELEEKFFKKKMKKWREVYGQI